MSDLRVTPLMLTHQIPHILGTAGIQQGLNDEDLLGIRRQLLHRQRDGGVSLLLVGKVIRCIF